MNTKEFVDMWLNERVSQDFVEASPEEQEHFRQKLVDICWKYKRAVIDEVCEWIENGFYEVDNYYKPESYIRASVYRKKKDLIEGFREYMEYEYMEGGEE